MIKKTSFIIYENIFCFDFIAWAHLILFQNNNFKWIVLKYKWATGGDNWCSENCNREKTSCRIFTVLFIAFCFTFTRSSLLEVFCNKVVLKNLTKFSRKHLCRSRTFNKVLGLKHATILKLEGKCFPLNFAMFLI